MCMSCFFSTFFQVSAKPQAIQLWPQLRFSAKIRLLGPAPNPVSLRAKLARSCGVALLLLRPYATAPVPCFSPAGAHPAEHQYLP